MRYIKFCKKKNKIILVFKAELREVRRIYILQYTIFISERFDWIKKSNKSHQKGRTSCPTLNSCPKRVTTKLPRRLIMLPLKILSYLRRWRKPKRRLKERNEVCLRNKLPKRTKNVPKGMNKFSETVPQSCIKPRNEIIVDKLKQVMNLIKTRFTESNWLLMITRHDVQYDAMQQLIKKKNVS